MEHRGGYVQDMGGASDRDPEVRSGVRELSPCEDEAVRRRIGTYSGGSFDILNPDPADVKLEDVAHALSRLCRYTGHTSAPWTVASHSLQVAWGVAERGGTPAQQLCGLFHDVSEAYLVDVPRPFKGHVSICGLPYRTVEDRVMRACALALGFEYPLPSLVGEVDHAVALIEIANFFTPGSFIWGREGVTDARRDFSRYAFVRPHEVEREFLAAYRQLKLAQVGVS